MKYTPFQEQRFRDSVAKAMQRVQAILDHTRHPRLLEHESDHTYADKFALAEFVTNTAVAAQMNAFERLGLDGDKLQTVIRWVHDDKKTVTMRLEASDSCTFFKERDVDVVTAERQFETTGTTNTTTTTTGTPGNPTPTAATSTGSGGFLSAITSSAGTSTATATTSPSGSTQQQKTETHKLKVSTKVKEYHWKVEVSYRLILFPGTDITSAIELQSRSTSTFIITSGGQAPNAPLARPVGTNNNHLPPTPIPESTQHVPIDVNMTWFFLQIEPKEQNCQFQIDRNSVKAQRTCKTPRRNDDIDAAFDFHQRLWDWTRLMQGYIMGRIESQIARAHNPAQKTASGSPETVELNSRGIIVGLQKEPTFNGKAVRILEYSTEQQRFRVEPEDKSSGLPSTLLIKPQNLRLDVEQGLQLNRVWSYPLFCPVLPLMENGAVFPDVAELLTEQCRSLDSAVDAIAVAFPPRQLVKLVSVAEATLVLLTQHLQDLCASYQDGVDYIENTLKQQLVQAIGKEIASKDFDQFMVFHNSKIFGADYAPTPFTYAVRQPGQYPVGTFTIECTRQRNDPIHTLVRHVPSDSAPSMFMPINAATSIELTGDRFLHGWMLHRFKTKPRNEYELVARARQFSSFLIVIGTLQGPDKFEPKEAIILQNKDEVLIPLMANTLPSAKEFKDSIASLSPEQKAFAQAYRNMQLESSVFGLCVIQLKPQLEKVLNLPQGSLTKEIQLTQELMSLFVEYQIPSDLLAFDGLDDVEAASKVVAVKGYVKSIMNVIGDFKEKQLVDEERKADVRAEMAFGSSVVPPVSAAFNQSIKFGAASPMDWNRSRPSVTFAEQNEAEPFLSMDTSEASTSSRGGMRNRRKLSYKLSKVVPQSSVTTLQTPSVSVRLENVQPPSKGGKAPPPSHSTSEVEDFTLIPKVLDAKLEKFDTDNALRSTVITAGSTWKLHRQENLLIPHKTLTLTGSALETEKVKAFDLLDAISRSGALSIESSELHIIIGVSHCFDNDVMGSIIQDNLNPIEKVEKSVLMLASTIYGTPPMSLLKDEQEVQRLTSAFPELGSSSADVEIYADQE